MKIIYFCLFVLFLFFYRVILDCRVISIEVGRLFGGDYSYRGKRWRGLDDGGGRRSGGKWWDFRDILKVELIRFFKDWIWDAIERKDLRVILRILF